jgi:hypothetical protein
VLIHFEICGAERWEALGSGESTGEVDPLQGAVDDLRSLHGGRLPTGTYRWIVAHGEDPRWEGFDLDPAGIVTRRSEA